MKKFRMPKKIISLFFAGLILLTSCVSTTLIRSNPTGAKVYIDGEPVGTTPYHHSDTKVIGSTTSVRLEKEGFDPFNTTFARNEELDTGALVGALFVWFPLLWIMKYKPVHSYELVPYSGSDQQKINTAVQQNPVKSKAERLRELKQLLDENLISQGDYEKEKKRILEDDK